MRKRCLALALCGLMTFCALPAAAAPSKETQQHAAELLYALGLFQGLGVLEDGSPDFDLEGTPTRAQAVTMLVRLLGKDAEAKSGQYSSPFKDVPDWAMPYVGYAYQQGLTTGTTATTFAGNDAVTATQYLTFVLRALGYSSQTDFQWDRAYLLSQDLMITEPGEYENAKAPFTRGDVAVISASALAALMKDSGYNLLSFLNQSGAFAESQLVILNLEVVTCTKDSMGFIFYPLPGSPNSYTSFKLNRVTVNGLPCTLTQYQNTAAAIEAMPELSMLYPDTFNYTLLTYDEEGALAAATKHYSPGNSDRFPILLFTFEGVGTLKSGKTVQESFSEAVYINTIS